MIRILIGDCVQRMKELPDNSVDSVVCDPPYHLTSIVKRFGAENSAPCKVGKTGAYARASKGFMGQTWDGGDVAFQPETWAEVLRVLKPGGMLAAFSGCRTYHRMVCAIEDAGFEVREMCSWNFGSGFPKSKNVFSDLAKAGLACTCPKTRLSSHYVSDENLHDLREALDAHNAVSGGAQQDVQPKMRGPLNLAQQARDAVTAQSQSDSPLHGLRSAGDKIAVLHCEGRAADVQQQVQRPSAGAEPEALLGQHEGPEARAEVRSGQSGVEGRSLPEACPRQLPRREVSASAGMGTADGEGGRLHHAAPASHGADVRLPSDANGSGEPQGSRPGEQSSVEPGTVADERGPQAWGGWPLCGGCSKPIIPEGLGSALKPAFEPICLARKPLSEKSIAANVLKWGTGGINIDACRIEATDVQLAEKYASVQNAGPRANDIYGTDARDRAGAAPHTLGRFPANLCHDGSDEVVAGFPDAAVAYSAKASASGGKIFQRGEKTIERHDMGGGSAARFFYCAKATTDERGEGNNHPTVKPVSLMRWLVRLVTPKGGTVLDPFAGSGSTLIAADAEQFNAIGCELSPEYAAIAEHRIRQAAGMFAQIETDKFEAAA